MDPRCGRLTSAPTSASRAGSGFAHMYEYLADLFQCLRRHRSRHRTASVPVRVENGCGNVRVRKIIGPDEIAVPVDEDSDARWHALLESLIHLSFRLLTARASRIEAGGHARRRAPSHG